MRLARSLVAGCTLVVLAGIPPASALGSPRATAPSTPAAGGDQLWLSRFDGPAHGDDLARSVAASPGGSRVFVTGRSHSLTSGDDYLTIAYDAITGVPLWSRRYDGTGGADEAWSIAVSPGGQRVFVTGDSTGGGTGEDYATVAYDAATGATIWARRYNGPGNGFDQALSVAVSPGGSKVFVTGFSFGQGTDYDYATVAYDAATGATVWARRYNGPGNGFDQALSLAVDPDGSKVFVTGSSYSGTGSRDDFTVAYDAGTATKRWEARDNTDSDGATFVAVSPDGSTVYVTGGPYDTFAYFAGSGDQLWHASYPGPGARLAFSVASNPSGSMVFVTGYGTGPGGGSGYLTVAYDAITGDQVWEANYSRTGHDFPDAALSLGVAPGGNEVFVTGYVEPGSGYQFATVAYDAATGDQLWVAGYRGPGGSDEGRWLAVSPDGARVYVTGWSEASNGHFDYVTIAYEAPADPA